MDPSSSAAALRAEIARLTGAIEQRKTQANASSSVYPPSRPRHNVYVNPNYKPPSRQVPISKPIAGPPIPAVTANPTPKEVVIGGVAFESSGRSLVRKDLPKPPASLKPPPTTRPIRRSSAFAKTRGSIVRPYKPKSSRGRNMTLNNSRRPFPRRVSNKRKYIEKPCPRFTTTGACSLIHATTISRHLRGVISTHRFLLTGACNRGLTCPYQHDPAKIAICWNFLQGNCPNTSETCNLSHDPTPERTPLCVHFANNGRCTRQNCPFPHVRVGQRHGVCRDFAVLGYCEKGLDCDKQHVRECPDFAEHGACTTKGCKLPHVIRASRTRKTAAVPPASSPSSGTGTPHGSTNPSAAASDVDSGDTTGANSVSGSHQVYAEDAQLGDEYISLTFHESESDSDENSVDDEDEDEEAADEQNEDIDMAIHDDDA
ncbi:unnamed protein product [Somion occarium]|uniref:C3H1-type domain-containing protein n=1 Tax=Somion occarium TaxID=3059160 RepID=A0ABP1E4N4_9APHY